MSHNQLPYRETRVRQSSTRFRAIVDLLPYSVYLCLGLGEIKPIYVILHLSDPFGLSPRKIVEDVLLKIDKFYYHIDFLVLDTQSTVDMESKI